MLHAVIMAGGSGTRFWPASRTTRPKQLLALASDDPLLRVTFDRIVPLVPAERVWVVTTADTADATRSLLDELDPGHVLAEPAGRDTAACVAYAARVLMHHDPDAHCLIFPADHVIPDGARFRSAMAAGATFVEHHGGLLTFGIEPTRPETGFGYLEVGARVDRVDEWAVHRLDRFVEKPDRVTAEDSLARGGFLWNSGMFAWRATDLLAEVRRQLPVLFDGIAEIGARLGTAEHAEALDAVYPRLPRTSVDFGIMESARDRFTIPVDFEWSDVGSWPALAEVLTTDDRRNVARGRTIRIDTDDSVLIGDGVVVAAVGVHDLVVVATPDAVLVVPRTEAQRVKEVVDSVRSRGWDDVL
ncbi:MAG: sugar phosphate nucleotidyltransferase [Holophagae bacterium]|jgi:mannose-1-phosphate guanylyltransferase